MKRAIAWLVLLVAVLRVGAADAASPPDGLTDVFIRFCGETRGDADLALHLADAEEWSVPRKGMTVPSFDPGTYWIRRQGRWSLVHGGRRMLMVGTLRGSDGKDALMCTVAELMPSGTKADLAGVQGALQKWVGGAPFRASGEFAGFAYRESHGVRMALETSRDPFANGEPRPPPDVAVVTFNYVLGMLMINYERSHEGPVEPPFGGAPSP